MFVIVRHGNTFSAGEPPRRIGARTDLPLTPAGQEQAARLGAHFAASGWRFSRVLVSPLRRTRETAQAILAAQADAPMPERCDLLREIDHGPDEDQTEDAVLARIGKPALDAWDAHGTVPPGWQVDAQARVAGWADLLRAVTPASASPTLLVTSNGAARFALLADPALAQSAAALDSLKLPTGGYGVIVRGPDGTLRVPAWGQRP